MDFSKLKSKISKILWIFYRDFSNYKENSVFLFLEILRITRKFKNQIPLEFWYFRIFNRDALQKEIWSYKNVISLFCQNHLQIKLKLSFLFQNLFYEGIELFVLILIFFYNLVKIVIKLSNLLSIVKKYIKNTIHMFLRNSIR